MPKSTSVTDPAELPDNGDLQVADTPASEIENSIDQAMNAAGLTEVPAPGEQADPPAPAAKPPVEPAAKPATEPAAAPAESEPPKPSLMPKTEPDGSIPPELEKKLQPTPAPVPDAEEAKRVAELESVKIDELQPPEDISPRNVVNFDKLRAVAKHWQEKATKAVELEAELAKLKTGEAVPEPLKKELEELRQFKGLFDLENDPKFQAEFNQGIDKLDDEVLAIMKRNGFSEADATALKKTGLGKVPLGWWEENILPNVPFIDAERIKKRLAERADLDDNRQQRLQQALTDRPAFFRQREEAFKKEYETYTSEIQRTVDALTKDVPWAQPVVVPVDGTPEQKAAAEAHNASVAQLETTFQEALWPKSAAARAEIACAAVAATKLAGDIKILGEALRTERATAAALRKEIETIKSAGRLPGTNVKPPIGDGKVLNLSSMSTDDAIEAGLQEAERSQ